MDYKLEEIKALHPGKALLENLKTENISQHDLAVRTGVSEKHISTIISGQKAISASFAKKLEYALSEKAGYWLNKQTEFDVAKAEFADRNEIKDEEILILKRLKELIDYLYENKQISCDASDYEKVLELRKLMKVSNLTFIPDISLNAAYRAQVKKNSSVDPFVLYAWQRTCELITENLEITAELNTERLKSYIVKMKMLMFEEQNRIEEKLSGLLAECGIAFKVVPHFVGAPVQGFIKKTDAGRVIFCITLRGKRADSFWFTFFHEVGHILNGDYGDRFVDFKVGDSSIEQRADDFSRKCLINDDDYHSFIMQRDFSLASINKFAELQGVRNFVVIGRLHKDELLEWSRYDSEIERYDWAVK